MCAKMAVGEARSRGGTEGFSQSWMGEGLQGQSGERDYLSLDEETDTAETLGQKGNGTFWRAKWDQCVGE